ncbi:ATP-dependent nuclease, subunit B, partial [human gut metagenome]
TGRKAFSLSDVWYGMGLQMLLYLFALERSGPARYGHEIVPAGVLYVPARDVLIPADRRLSPEEAARERAGAVRRSGLLLDDAAVLHAMEHSDTPQYLPVSPRRKTARSQARSSSACSRGILKRHCSTSRTSCAAAASRPTPTSAPGRTRPARTATI